MTNVCQQPQHKLLAKWDPPIDTPIIVPPNHWFPTTLFELSGTSSHVPHLIGPPHRTPASATHPHFSLVPNLIGPAVLKAIHLRYKPMVPNPIGPHLTGPHGIGPHIVPFHNDFFP